MASLPSKLTAEMAFKAGGDVFHDIVANKPQHLTKATEAHIQACDLQQGSYGTNGFVVQGKYTVDGKEQTAKQVLQDIEKTRSKLLTRYGRRFNVVVQEQVHNNSRGDQRWRRLRDMDRRLRAPQC